MKQDNRDIGSIFAISENDTFDDVLICDGSSLSASSYSLLYAKIGTSWGNPGAGQFSLPDLQGAFLRGSGTNARYQKTDLSYYSGAHGTFNYDTLASHTHSTALSGLYGRVSSSWPGVQTLGTFNTDSAISDGSNGTPRVAMENKPASYGIKWVIKYK